MIPSMYSMDLYGIFTYIWLILCEMMVNKPYMDAMDREGTTATATDVCQCWPHLLSFSFSSFSAIGVGITWQVRIDSVENILLKPEGGKK